VKMVATVKAINANRNLFMECSIQNVQTAQ
jgi:hypothetical protein